MAIGGKPNGSYIFNVVLPAEFALVTQPDYFTDVQAVLRPTYGADELAQIIASCADGPSVSLWIDSESEEVPGKVGGPLKDRCKMRVIVVGAMRRKDDIQAAIMGLAADIRRVMRGNNHRIFPGGTDQGIVVNTTSSGSPTFDFGYYKEDQSGTIATVYSQWDIEYWFPLATG
jgi:hypothetical protein